MNNRPVAPRQRKVLPWLTVLNLTFLVLLWLLETFVAERHPLTALLLYLPQHGAVLPAGILCLWALARREWRILACNSAALACCAVVFLGFNVPRHSGKTRGTTGHRTALRVMTYNVHYGAAGTAHIAKVLDALRPDIICLQETRPYNRWPDPVPRLQRHLRGWHMARGAEVTTFSRYPFVFQRSHPMPAKIGRVVLETRVRVKGQELTVFNVHLSTTGATVKRPRHYVVASDLLGGSAAIRREQVDVLLPLAHAAPAPVLIMGDFNNPPRGRLYRRLTRHFQDAFRAAGWGLGYTFRADLPVLRIDYVFASPQVGIQRCFAPSVRASDHRPVVAELVL